MRLSMGLRWGLLLCSGGLLSACLVGKDDIKNYTISLPSKLPIYADGHYIKFGYELYGVIDGNTGSQTTSTSGSLRMNWSLTSLSLPFEGTRTVLQHTVTEDTVEGERTSIQYITQDTTNGSVFLNAYRGVTNRGVISSYWPDADGSLNTPVTTFDTVRTLASPIDDGIGGSWVGIDQNSGGALNHTVMGPCTSSSCPPFAQVNFTDYAIKGIDNLTTPLGNFEAYRLYYSGYMAPSTSTLESAYFDYRVSCGTPGSSDQVNFYGYVWIYPPIGPIKLQNNCYTANGLRTVYFNAQITSTNLPH